MSGENFDCEKESEEIGLEKNLDGFIDKWGADLRDEWTKAGKLGRDDFRGMHRTALISICRLREGQAAIRRGHALFSLWYPDMRDSSVEELLRISDPSTEERTKLLVHGRITPDQANL